jgi:nucleoside-diphosphate-sugar epimerase
LRIRNVALASSETVFGIPLHPHPPSSLPITEDVERPESSYSLSKLMGEKMAEQFCRWDPEAKLINIRLSNVQSPSDYAKFASWQDDPWARAWKYVDSLAGLITY